MPTPMPTPPPYGWATSLVNRTAPIMPMISLGFLPGQKPGNGVINALFGNLMDWVGFYSGFAARAMMILGATPNWYVDADSTVTLVPSDDTSIRIVTGGGGGGGVKGTIGPLPGGGKVASIKARIDTNASTVSMVVAVISAPVGGVATQAIWGWTGVSDGSAEVSLSYVSGETGTLDGPCNAVIAIGTALSTSVDFNNASITFGAP